MKTKYRYPGTEPFKVEDKDLFFGREQDTAQLYQLIKLEQIVVLHGKSGYGKTSLLRAGILPILERESNYRSRYIRVGRYFEDNNSLKQLFLTQVFGEHLPKSDLLEALLPHEDTLWEFFKSAQLQSENSNSFLLLLDQFEEFFSYPLAQQETFFSELADLLFVKVPKTCKDAIHAKMDENADFFSGNTLSSIYQALEIKVVFSIRSDKLSFVDEIKSYVPNVLQNTYILDALSPQQAADAILLPSQLPGDFSSPIFQITKDAELRIIEYLADKRNKRIEAFQLQMICQYIELYLVIEDGAQVITPALLGNLEDIVENFYDKQIEKLGDISKQELAREVMKKLIFEEDLQRLQLYEKQLLKEISITTDLLTKMEAARLIRAEISSLGTRTYEITHDTLVVAVVKSKNRKQQQQIESAKEEKAKLQKKVNEFEQKWSDDIERLNTEIASFERKQSKGWNNVLRAFSAENTRDIAHKYLERGDLYYNLANYDQAIEDYEKSLALNPNSSLASLRLGNCFYASKQYDNALKYYTKSIELDPNSEWAYRNRGLVKQSQKRYEEALEDYRKSVELNPAYASPYNDMGIVFETLKAYDTALEHYEKARAIESDNALYYANIGNIYRYKEQLEDAKSYLMKGLALDPQNKSIHNGLGNIFLDQKNYDEAIKHYDEAIKISPYEAIYFRNRGLASKNISVEIAIKDYQKAIALDSKYSEPHNDIGVLYNAQQEYEKAIENYNRAIEIDPDNPMYYRNRALAYQFLNRIEEAESDFNKTIAINPNHAIAHNDLGLIYHNYKIDYLKAIDYYSKAIAIDDSNTMYYRNRALAYQALEEIEKAEEDYKKIITINPNYATVYNDLGLISYKNKHNSQEAITYYSKAIAIEEDKIYYRNRALAHQDLGQIDEAEQDFRKAVELDPEYDVAYNDIGLIYHNYKGDYQKAIDMYSQAIAIQPNSALYYRNRALAHQTLNNQKEAVRDFQEAITVDPSYTLVYNDLGLISYHNADYDAAIELFEKAFISDDPSEFVYQNIGNAYRDKGAIDTAKSFYRKGLERYPTSVDLYNLLGNIYLDTNEPEKAIAAYDKIIEISDQSEDHIISKSYAHYNEGIAYQSLSEYRIALYHYNRCATLHPEFVDAIIQAGFMHAALEEYDLALQKINEGIENTTNVPAWYYATRAWVYKLNKQFDLATKDVNHALELDPTNAFSINTKGCILYSSGSYEQAENYFQQALELNPQEESYTSNLAETYVALGKLEEAEKELNWLLEKFPEDGFKHFILAKWNLQKGKETAFYTALQKALEVKYPHYFHSDLQHEPLLLAHQTDPQMQRLLKRSEQMWKAKLHEPTL